MDAPQATIIVALIAAVASIVATLGMIMNTLIQRRQRTQLRDDLEKARGDRDAVLSRVEDEKAASANSMAALGRLVGYELDEFRSTTTIHGDGSCDHERTWSGVRVNQAISNLRIPVHFTTSGTTSAAPAVSPEAGSRLGAHYEAGKITHTDAGSVREGSVVLDGLITPEIKPVGFVLKEENLKGAFCVTREEALKRYEQDAWTTEYAASSISVPAQVLKKVVKFPPSHKGLSPGPQAVVFIGETGEVVDKDETKCVQSGLTTDENSVTLTVQNPKIGYHYAVTWMPPPRTPD